MLSSDPIATETAEAVGARVREHRVARRLSMEKLAQLCGFSKETVRAIEAGEQAPRLHTFLLLVSALDLQLEDLLPGDWMTRYAPGARDRGRRPIGAEENSPRYGGVGDSGIDARLLEAAKTRYPGLSTSDLLEAALKGLIESDATARARSLAGRMGTKDVSQVMRRKDRTS